MAIRIDRVSVKNCGPVAVFNQDFGDINLIYSENERGKSFLVEFMIHSLFKNKSFWKDLRTPGQGKLIISGLESLRTEFSPSKRKKLEDYLSSDKRGLPPSLANLLVIKEGQTDLVKNEQGLDKNSIKEILSPRRVLDEIESDRNISATIKKGKIEGGEILIERRGEGNSYYELKETLRSIESLLDQIVDQYEQGKLRELEIKKESLLRERELLLRAKRHQAYLTAERLKFLRQERERVSDEILENLRNLTNEHKNCKESLEKLNMEVFSLKKRIENLNALYDERDRLIKARAYEAYQISKEIEAIERELDRLPEEELIELNQKIRSFSEKKSERLEKERVLRELREKSKNYLWLRSARENYERLLYYATQNRDYYKVSLVSIPLFIISLILIFFEHKTIGITLSLISFFGLLFFAGKLRNYSKARVEELNAIREDFLRRTGSELRTLSDLLEKLNTEETASLTLTTNERELERLERELSILESDILKTFQSFGFQNLEEPSWYEKYSELRVRRGHLISRYQKLRASIEELNIKEYEYETKDPGVRFDRERFQSLTEEITRLENLKEQLEIKLEEKGKLEKTIEMLDEKIKQGLERFGHLKLSGDSYFQAVREIENYIKKIDGEITRLEGLLKGYGVSERDYLIEKTERSFSQEELDRVEKELAIVESKIIERNRQLNNLREKIIQLTGIDTSASWSEMIERVYQKREGIRRDLEEVEAKIIAGILLHREILELRQQEDQKLSERLNSPEITSYIERLTGRYKSISFEENDIIVSDDFSNFKLTDLSTGAREQLMIALRIAFAKSILNNTTAFLIFDDAFQHSDYKKREILVKTLIELSRQGWQIFYFTMDQHIMELFRNFSKNSNYKEIHLK